MSENFADKKLSDFMYQGMDTPTPGNPNFNQEHSDAMHKSDSTVSDASDTSRLRKMSHQVKSMISGAKQALNLDSGEDINTMTINEEVQVIEWAPAVFHAIKKIDGITPQMIEESLSTDANTKQLFKAKESAGKSGSFMFSTYDKRFLIKTMNKSE